MRVTPIPDSAVWEGARRIVIGPPDGDPTGEIRAVEAVVDRSPTTGSWVYSVRCALEEGDLDTLAAGGHVWISFYDRMVPFSVDVVAPPEVSE